MARKDCPGNTIEVACCSSGPMGRFVAKSVALRSISLTLKNQAQFAEADCNKRSRRLIEFRREAASPTALYLHPHWAVRRVLKNRDSAAKLADLISGSVTELEPCLSLVPAFVVGAG